MHLDGLQHRCSSSTEATSARERWSAVHVPQAISSYQATVGRNGYGYGFGFKLGLYRSPTPLPLV